MNKIAAIILAAGKGTRMKSAKAKVAFPIAGKPMLQRVVNTATALDCQRVAVVVGYQKEAVMACLEPDTRLSFVEQSQQLGTGHAVSICEESFVDYQGDIVILCGDVPLLREETIAKLYDEHIKSKAVCTVLTAVLDDAGRYGRILRDDEGRVCGIVEYKDATDSQRAIGEFNTGIYIFRADELFGALKQTSNTNQQGEYYLTDCLGIFYNQGKVVSSVILQDLMEVSGVNSQEQLAELEDEFIRRIRLYWLNNGVVIHNPASVYIDDEVELASDVEIDQNCVLKGRCQIASGVRIGPGTYLEDAIIGSQSSLKGYNVIVGANLEAGSCLDYYAKRLG